MPANTSPHHAAAALAALLALAAVAAACGGGGGSQATPTAAPTQTITSTRTATPRPTTTAVQGEYWSRAQQVIRRLVPEASRLELGLFDLSDPERPAVDMIVFARLPGGLEPRLHIILGSNERAQPLGRYHGDFELYKVEAITWAKLVGGELPLWAGSPDEDGLKAYLDFYLSGEPPLTNEHFWNAFSYAEGRISGALGGDISQLRIDFDDGWNPRGHDAGGIAFRAAIQGKQAYVGILYSEGDGGLDFASLATTLGGDFRQRFALPDIALEESQSREWGYANHIWYGEWETGR